ncbi:V-type ATP synthase subunit I [Clostridium botulinum]|uniref:V-type ATP synthase subunit I n=1 Tax=Clostridium botulinum TaxID=1491 RepID=A0AA43Y712_CLOBO|nr:V-type ATP synthase subunit I [Clostridium botulinum]NFI21494.1 V-type ATP synthase subunit I [Clostridium botulinum]NFQ78834.1 V-type ATP synthase subunit I [Clostridium botulinum]
MGIAKMKKFTLLALESHKESLFEAMQKFQEVQFVNLQEEKSEKLEFMQNDSQSELVSDLEGKQAKLKFCLDILERYVQKEKGLKALMKGKKFMDYNELKNLGQNIEWMSIYNTLREKDTKLSALKNEISKPKGEIKALEPWINFDEKISKAKFNTSTSYLGVLPLNYKDEFRETFDSEIPVSYVETIGENKDGVYLFVVFHNDYFKEASEVLKRYGFSKIAFNYDDSPKETIKALEEEIKSIKKEEIKTIEGIKVFTNKLEDLQIAYEYISLQVDREKASMNILKTDRIVAMEGWVPEESMEELEGLIRQSEDKLYYIEFNDPLDEEEEKVPIMLKNNKIVEPFESITAMYSLPKYKEIDPTPALVPFYLIFFGMMLSDAGYGLVMLICTLLALKTIPMEKATKQMIKLLYYLSYPTIVWGALYGSYFGGIINIPAIWVKPEDSVSSILIISIVFGIIHLYTGLGVKAYMLIRNKRYKDAFYDVGLWYITLTTAIIIVAANFGNITALNPYTNSCKYIMYAGMVGLVLTQGRENKTIGAKLGAGLYGLYGITSYVGDIVSYSRLMALGLATGFIGGAFNLMISLLGNGVKAWVFGTLIFVIGHVFNLLINALGAYVHTCRLQYVEYFGKFYEGGGKPFTPFKPNNKYINIIKD